MTEIDIAIIGAGAAGLAAGQRLKDAQVSALLLEARDRIGGRGWTIRDPMSDLPMDMGCGWLHSADANEWAQIAPARGFTIDRSAPPWGKQSGGRGFTQQELKDFRAARTRFWERADAAADIKPDCAAATLLESGNRWNALIDATSTYINGVELEQLSLRDYGRYHDTDVNWRVREGYGALIASIGAELDIRCETPVTRIDHTGARLRIETSHGVVSARAAIVTVPPTLIADETLRFVPQLPEKLKAAHALPLGLADKLFLRIHNLDDFPSDGHLYGAIDRVDTGSYNLRPLGRPLIESYFGGAFARALEAEGGAGFAAVALDQLASLFGGDIRKRLTPVAATGWDRDPWARGSYSYARVGQAEARTALALPVEDRLFFAGEACSRHDFSTAHGAYRTGIAAADAALAALAEWI
jgi:monoamine oxidase